MGYLPSKTQLFIINIIIWLGIVFTTLSETWASPILEEVKAYINSIKSIALEFEQIDSKGNKAAGILIIDKPYKFRCNYYKPFPLLIIGNKNYVSVYDYEMEHLSRIKSNKNVFYFLLINRINFEQEFNIILEKEKKGRYVIKLSHADLNRVSRIEFDKNTKELVRMKIYEENNVIKIHFNKTHKIKDVQKNLFIIQDPDIFGLPVRLDKQQLEKKYELVS